jgi:hypothetical protein
MAKQSASIGGSASIGLRRMALGHLLLLPPEERSIALQTRRGTDIPNDIAAESGPAQIAKYERLRRGHLAWRPRKPACGGYNCFGLVFASRRTSIRDHATIVTILKDDGYRLTAETDLRPGDIILYKDPTGGEFIHAGLVLSMRPIAGGGSTQFAHILSKWDDCCGEDEHSPRDYPRSWGEDLILEYRTDRQLEESLGR